LIWIATLPSNCNGKNEKSHPWVKAHYGGGGHFKQENVFVFWYILGDLKIIIHLEF
jgi:hypothetical protein